MAIRYSGHNAIESPSYLGAGTELAIVGYGYSATPDTISCRVRLVNISTLKEVTKCPKSPYHLVSGTSLSSSLSVASQHPSRFMFEGRSLTRLLTYVRTTRQSMTVSSQGFVSGGLPSHGSSASYTRTEDKVRKEV